VESRISAILFYTISRHKKFYMIDPWDECHKGVYALRRAQNDHFSSPIGFLRLTLLHKTFVFQITLRVHPFYSYFELELLPLHFTLYNVRPTFMKSTPVLYPCVRKVIKPLLMRQTNSVHPYSRLAHLPKTF
jgi:hypothetical protein